jgi:large subunit ribosomal protein L28
MMKEVGDGHDPGFGQDRGTTSAERLDFSDIDFCEPAQSGHATRATVQPEWDLLGFAANLRSGRGDSPDSSAFRPSQEFLVMSYRCEICGKEPSYGKTVSFSHKRNNRRWLPNIQRVRVRHGSNTRRARVCTSCIRAGKVEKA